MRKVRHCLILNVSLYANEEFMEICDLGFNNIRERAFRELCIKRINVLIGLAKSIRMIS